MTVITYIANGKPESTWSNQKPDSPTVLSIVKDLEAMGATEIKVRVVNK